MQYIYTECKLPSNGKIYKTNIVHLRPKTIFDIKVLLNNPVFMLKSEINTLQNCIDPNDKVNVYDLVNQDVVYLLYKLRSLSNDVLNFKIQNKDYTAKISELDVEYLEEFNNKIKLPVSNIDVTLAYQPIKNVFNFAEQEQEFLSKYPDYKGDVANTITLLNSIESINNSVNKDNIRNILESLCWEDSIFLINKIEELNKLQFGVKEEVTFNIDDKDITIPIQITETFFRSAL